ncbi:unnamed protein product [Ranitomeya imitator]|uniref:CTCK domain-containing protein n=1 Tax=Ranitomeya imitator TaxID=111125 RepID=A0ABN9L2P2_9NEOB|nr:unnamed protein product [Ranitomeya imitator]
MAFIHRLVLIFCTQCPPVQSCYLQERSEVQRNSQVTGVSGWGEETPYSRGNNVQGPLLDMAGITIHAESVSMMIRFLIGFLLPAGVFAAPPPINRLALFPDKSAWCEAKNITQIVGHSGCESKSIQNRACLGQCFSYSVPNTFPQSTESPGALRLLYAGQVHVTLECPGNEEVPRVDKLVEKILRCSCQACGKELSQEGAMFNVYLNTAEEALSPAENIGRHQHRQEEESPPAAQRDGESEE